MVALTDPDLLFPPDATAWARKLKAGATLRMGERIGTLRGWQSDPVNDE